MAQTPITKESVKDTLDRGEGTGAEYKQMQDAEVDQPARLANGDDYDNNDNETYETKSSNSKNSTILSLPFEIREKIYSHLVQSDALTLRLVCNQTRLEIEVAGRFIIQMTECHHHLSHTTIPFPSLYLLHVDSDAFELPWGDCVNDEVDRLLLQNLTFKTFITIGKFVSVQDATLTSLVFKRPIPPLSWANLKSLQIVFHVPQQFIERFMLDNLDMLLHQEFDSLQSFRISLMNPYAHNYQAMYSNRLARFVGKHWRTLKSLEIEMEARRCTELDFEEEAQETNEYSPECRSSQYAMSNQLSSEEKENFLKKVRLQNLEMRVTELSCPRCAIWQDFIRGQTKLKCLLLNIVDAGDLSSNFFCNPTLTQFQDLTILSLNLWGIEHVYQPFDCKFLERSKELTFCEVGRHHMTENEPDISELLNIELLPEKISTLILDGFVVESNQILQILEKLGNLKYVSVLNSGSGPDLGLHSEHAPTLSSLPNIISCLIDFNNEEEALDILESLDMVESKLDGVFDTKEWSTKCFSQTLLHVSCYYHRFLFTKTHGGGKWNEAGLNIYDKLTRTPPCRYTEEETSFFHMMKDMVLASRYSGLLYDLATSASPSVMHSNPVSLF